MARHAAVAPEYLAEGHEGFAEPYVFLDDFVDEATAYEGLYAYFSHELLLGHEGEVRGYVEGLTLDPADQDRIRDSLRSLLEKRDETQPSKAAQLYHPMLDASINYLKYRLAVGLAEPAISVALNNTNPEHTNVRIVRTLVAMDLVRNWVYHYFKNSENAAEVPGLIDRELAGYVRQSFNEQYAQVPGNDFDLLVRKYTTSGFPFVEVDRKMDRPKLFDINDFSFRFLHLKPNGKLPTVEEIDEIKSRPPTPLAPRGLRMADYNNSGYKPSIGEIRRIRTRVIIEAFSGLGLFSGEADSELRLQPRVDSMRPRDLVIARRVAEALLRMINGGYNVRKKPAGDGREIPGEVGTWANGATLTEIRQRLQALIRTYDDREWMSADEFFGGAYEEYVARYGQVTTRRDFWDIDEESPAKPDTPD